MQVELDRAVKEQHPSSRTSTCSFVERGTGAALQSDVLSAPGVRVSDETVRNRPQVRPVLSVQHHAARLVLKLSASGSLFSSPIRGGSHWAHVTSVKMSGDAVDVILPVGARWFGMEGTDLHVKTLTAVRCWIPRCVGRSWMTKALMLLIQPHLTWLQLSSVTSHCISHNLGFSPGVFILSISALHYLSVIASCFQYTD